MTSVETHAGQAVYTPLVLKLYDIWVLGLSNRFAWRTDTDALVALYQTHMGPLHLDVGVGTGTLPWRALQRSSALRERLQQLWLMDLNPESLAAAAKRLHSVAPHNLQHDIFDPAPVPLPADLQLSSISANYLLHCLPGGMAAKGAALTRLAGYLAPDGVLFGSTLLGDGPQTWLGQRLMALYNRKGIFDNLSDDAPSLEQVLSTGFSEVSIQRSGRAALFVAKYPRNKH
ncbi:MAG: class I SAM-dependent methyltransferase [Rhodospirillaceae bacterium]